MKTLITLTVIETTREDGNGDCFPEIAAIGYDRTTAIGSALSAIRYACCRDFTDPATCAPGTLASYYRADAVELLPGEDEDDIAEELGWDYGIRFNFNGKTFLLPSGYAESCECGDIASSDVRRCHTWAEAADLAAQKG